MTYLLSLAVSSMRRLILLGRQATGEGTNSRFFADGAYSNNEITQRNRFSRIRHPALAQVPREIHAS